MLAGDDLGNKSLRLAAAAKALRGTNGAYFTITVKTNSFASHRYKTIFHPNTYVVPKLVRHSLKRSRIRGLHEALHVFGISITQLDPHEF